MDESLVNHTEQHQLLFTKHHMESMNICDTPVKNLHLAFCFKFHEIQVLQLLLEFDNWELIRKGL